ncbi:MAG: fumarate reductase/succinate dehydrogenase flavoprotein domain protein [Subtercola sp.]|nr:fumarate reductase/succinate dehydrogenase flavoprotein domain protein [Subtercola sp.]
MTGTLDETVDLIVVGFGAAGAAAALTAADVGARVLVLEKQAQEAHSPSTRMSGGVIMGVDDVERATRYLDRCAGGLIPTDVTRAWAQWAHEVFDWLRGAGVDVTYRPEGFGEHPTIDGYDAVRFWRHATLRDGSPVSEEYRGSAAQLALGDAQAVRAQGRSLARSGTDLWDALAAAVADRRTVEVRWESPARRLLTDETGRVVGVEHGLGDGARTYARHGVVLACGGFEFDDGMKENFLRLRPVHFYGNRANTGDGVRLAQAVGADLWHMNTFVGRGVGHFELDGEPMTSSCTCGPVAM